MNQFGNVLKSAPFAVWIILLALVATGCNDNHLKWNKEQACISYDGAETCIPAGGGYRLQLKEGKPVFTSLETRGLPGRLEFPQYAPAQPLKVEQLSVAIENGKLVLLEGETRMVDEIGIGFLLMPNAEGRMEIMVPVLAEVKPRPFKFDRAGRMLEQKQPVSFVDIIQSKSTPVYLAMTSVLYFNGGDAVANIPNDTGTIVIIIDNYKVVGSCDAEVPDDCCAGVEGAGGILDPSGSEASYAAIGQKLLGCFPLGSLCIYVNGNKVIVIDCASSQRYCLTVTEGCPIRITPSDADGICFSIPLACSMENPFVL